MRIALATCRNLPDWEVDDAPLHAALLRRGVDLTHPAWDDAEFEWHTCDAVLIRTTWDYQERRDEFLRWAGNVARDMPLFNPFPVLQWNTDKHYLMDLNDRGVPTVPTVWLSAGSAIDLPTLLDSRGWQRAFLKPAIGATARETLRFRADADGLASAKAHLDRLLPREAMLLQPYLQSVEQLGELSLVFIDGQFSHAVHKFPVPGDYRVQDDFGARDEPARITDEQMDLACRVIAAAAPGLLYARTDFLHDDDGNLRLTELELVEPSMFFRHGADAADRLADALIRRVVGRQGS